ncbi:hypothetical protein [Anditalea andensis]|uniref:Uncharacterized protein n=1 Tax=Anditalea andensis TaxID=1048983 RepID=A0A074KUS8_9BACT|nr:hypothetical protein [Anditalea andensis]KEO72020.1 hypothetical protein EL17_19075 [Anditalea andensis]
MKKKLKLDYYGRVHFFWTLLLLVVGYQLNHSYREYIAENNLYDFEFSRAGIAGISMAAVYFMISFFHRKEIPVYQFAFIFSMYFIFETYPVVFNNQPIDYWRFAYLGLAGSVIWFFYIPFQKKHQGRNTLSGTSILNI